MPAPIQAVLPPSRENIPVHSNGSLADAIFRDSYNSFIVVNPDASKPHDVSCIVADCWDIERTWDEDQTMLRNTQLHACNCCLTQRLKPGYRLAYGVVAVRYSKSYFTVGPFTSSRLSSPIWGCYFARHRGIISRRSKSKAKRGREAKLQIHLPIILSPLSHPHPRRLLLLTPPDPPPSPPRPPPGSPPPPAPRPSPPPQSAARPTGGRSKTGAGQRAGAAGATPLPCHPRDLPLRTRDGCRAHPSCDGCCPTPRRPTRRSRPVGPDRWVRTSPQVSAGGGRRQKGRRTWRRREPGLKKRGDISQSVRRFCAVK
ncbi:hypothetical protein F5Y17DRAFT_83740 [Xylariaceae sp. FL0594]|nr:hypothetical protein F5Y17DRAFT_83740 [Xylariaceae sp. FL0594]